MRYVVLLPAKWTKLIIDIPDLLCPVCVGDWSSQSGCINIKGH